MQDDGYAPVGHVFDSRPPSHYGVVRARSLRHASVDNPSVSEKEGITGIVGVGGLGGVGAGVGVKASSYSVSTASPYRSRLSSTNSSFYASSEQGSIQELGSHESRNTNRKDYRSLITCRNFVHFLLLCACTVLMTTEILLRKYVVTVSMRNYLVTTNLVLTACAVVTFTLVLWYNSRQRKIERKRRRRIQALLAQGVDPLSEYGFDQYLSQKDGSLFDKLCCSCCRRSKEDTSINRAIYIADPDHEYTHNMNNPLSNSSQALAPDLTHQQSGASVLASPGAHEVAVRSTGQGSIPLTPHRNGLIKDPMLTSDIVNTPGSAASVTRSLAFDSSQSGNSQGKGSAGPYDEDDDDDDDDDDEQEDDLDMGEYDEEEGDFEEVPGSMANSLNPAALIQNTPASDMNSQSKNTYSNSTPNKSVRPTKSRSGDPEKTTMDFVETPASNEVHNGGEGNWASLRADSVNDFEFDPAARFQLSDRAKRWECIFFFLLCNGCTCWTKRGGHHYVRGRVPTLRRRCRLLWLRLRYIIGIALIDTIVLITLLHATKQISAGMVGFLTQMVHPATVASFVLFQRRRPSKTQIFGTSLIVVGAALLLAHAWRRSIWAEEAQKGPMSGELREEILHHFRGGSGFFHAFCAVMAACGVALSSCLREKLLTHRDPKVRLSEDVALAVSAAMQFLFTIALSHPAYALLPPDGSPASVDSSSPKDTAGLFRNISHGFQCWINGKSFIKHTVNFSSSSQLEFLSLDVMTTLNKYPPLNPTLPLKIIVDHCQDASLYASIYFAVVLLLNITIVISVHLRTPGPYFAGSFAAPFIAMAFALSSSIVGVIHTKVFPLQIVSAAAIGIGAIVFRLAPEAVPFESDDDYNSRRLRKNRCLSCLSFVFCGCQFYWCCSCCRRSEGGEPGILDDQVAILHDHYLNLPSSSKVTPYSANQNSFDTFDETKDANRIEGGFNVGSLSATSATISLPVNPLGFINTANQSHAAYGMGSDQPTNPYETNLNGGQFGFGFDTPSYGSSYSQSIASSAMDQIVGRMPQGLTGLNYRQSIGDGGMTPGSFYYLQPGLDSLSYNHSLGMSIPNSNARATPDILSGNTGRTPRSGVRSIQSSAGVGQIKTTDSPARQREGK